MNRRIILIIAGALLFALLVGLAWWWFFRSVPERLPQGSFGSGQERQGAGGQGGAGGNISSNVTGGGSGQGVGGTSAGGAGQGGNTTGVNINLGGSGSQSGSGEQSGNGGGVNNGSISTIEQIGNFGTSTYGTSSTTPEWLTPTTTIIGGGGRTTNFTPSTINQLNEGTVGGSTSIAPTTPTTESGGTSSYTGLAGLFGAGAGCALLFVNSAGPATGEAAARGTAAVAGGALLVYDFNAAQQRSQNQYKDVYDCIARTIAKAVIQQMTNSVVNWINTGFNGKPSFITNYEKFFASVGDQAAGEFIQGSGLSFLCSPFKGQIKVAIAQSYARRGAPSCSLTGVINNINSFMNGNFAQGGWRGFLQFTTVPTNNPFGAYGYAQAGLQGAQVQALSNARNNISPGGFLSVQKCDPPGSKNCKVVTPGSVIEDSLKTTLQQPYLANQLAKSFDEIVSALLNQLMVKTLYNGLSSVSGQSGYSSSYLTPEQQQAQTEAQNLLTEMQAKVQTAQQFGAVQQGSIRDIQVVQERLETVLNCWETASSSPTLSAAQREQAQKGADEALANLKSFDELVDGFNDEISRANTVIAKLQELQTQLISASTPAEVAAAKSAYNSALASGALISADEVTTEQQNRTTLQGQLKIWDTEITARLKTCNAL